MNKVASILSALTGGIYTTYWTWERFYNLCDSIITGLVVTIISYGMLRLVHLIYYRGERKKKYIRMKQRKHNIKNKTNY